MNENPPTEGSQPAAESAPTFDVLPLSDEVRRALAEVGYTHPTPVQVAVWEPATRGKDAVVQARTGTGKTASFGLPIVDHIVRRSTAAVQALVLCPTRELALQVAAELERLGKHRDVKILPIYGGASMERQISGIQAGAQVVAGTPGRVLDHIRRGTLNTSAIKLLVLDEADEMLSMGFERELSAILEALPPSRQTLLFSATVPPDIERIAKNRLKNPEFVTLSGDHIGALEIDHYTYLVQADKIGSLVRVLESENPENAIIFCNTKEETETVTAALNQRGYDADWLNGDLPQGDREKVMAATREGRLRFLVATDVAARGIDVSHVTHVINYDFPMDAESYVHRTGRTGRAGRTGTAISLITPHDIGSLYYLRLTYKIRPVERQIPTTEELRTRAETDLLSMLAETLASKGNDLDDRALARRLLSHDQSEMLVAGLLRTYLDQAPKAQQDADRLRRQPRRASIKRRPDAPGRAERSRAPAVEEPVAAATQQPSTPGVPGLVAPAPTGPARERDRDRDRPRRGREHDRDRPAGPRRSHDRPPREGGARDFTQWSPPEEEGDDEPLLPTRDRRPGRGPGDRPQGDRPHAQADRPQGDRPQADRPNERVHADRPQGDRPARREPREPREPAIESTPAPVVDDVPYVELFVGVGRRDNARAQDVLRALVETAGLDKDHIRRIRVRDRHTFVGVRRDDAEKAIAGLSGSTIGTKSSVNVELARERSADDLAAAVES
ncbi:MAG: DEAD/DEAH box helicase [Myxococcales bacterium]|nr:DEAD/DEAH box helicase [Myxococcales bacterium]